MGRLVVGPAHGGDGWSGDHNAPVGVLLSRVSTEPIVQVVMWQIGDEPGGAVGLVLRAGQCPAGLPGGLCLSRRRAQEGRNSQ